MELTILMPCLNESETLAICIRKARAFLSEHQIDGEVLIADNGSTDGSQSIAETEGARVVAVPAKGYGSALTGGIEAAKGMYIIMGDADDSYDFSALLPFVQKLRNGADLVMGNRFAGGIAPGAMPFLHKYLGNPVLSWLGRLFFSMPVRDFHCGLRGFRTDKIRRLDLQTTGMEFASELVVRSALARYSVEEVPTTLSPDGRSRPPHLRTWRDGWRHLSFLLMYSPRWLFFYPALALLLVGGMVVAALHSGPIVLDGVQFDIHTFVVACFTLVIGTQAAWFAVIARKFGYSHKLLPKPSRFYSRIMSGLSLERVMLVAVPLTVVGIGGLIWCVGSWALGGFGPIAYTNMLRVLAVSLAAVAIGMQSIFSAFLSSIIEIPTK